MEQYDESALRVLAGTARPDDSPGRIEMGTVGWEDETEWVDFGTTEDGYTLVRVQLYRGRDTSQPRKDGVAQGTKILAQLNTLGIKRIPPKGARCWVAMPAGFETTPGAAVLFAIAEKTDGTTQLQKDRAVVDFGQSTHVVFRGASISLQDYSNRFLSVGVPRAGGAAGITINDETGSGMLLASGKVVLVQTDGGTPPQGQIIVQLSGGAFDIAVNGGSGAGLKIVGGDVTAWGTNFYTYTAGTYLGPLATAATPARYGTPAVPLVSTTVFLSP